MTELIKEQFFQHQMSQNKDDEIAAMETTSGHWPSEGSISGLQSLYGDESIQESLSDVSACGRLCGLALIYISLFMEGDVSISEWLENNHLKNNLSIFVNFIFNEV